jgi:hypothetical protein
MYEALNKLGYSKLKPFYREAARLDPKKVQTPDFQYIQREFPKIGLRLAEQLLGPLGQEIIASDAEDAHLTGLSYALAKTVINIQRIEPAFREEVARERRRRRTRAEQRSRQRGNRR